MKNEYKYFGLIFFMFILSIATLVALFRKYALLTFQHFVETCQQFATTFFSSGTHFIGLALIVLSFMVALIFGGKTILSILKTLRKIEGLLKYKTNIFPKKLVYVLIKVGLKKDQVIVVKRKLDYAFSFGVRSQKIMLSEGLIEKLSTKQLEAVVLHEWYHLQNKHSLFLVASEIFSSTLFFLPLVSEIHKKMKTIFETQADSFTRSVQGNNLYLEAAVLKIPNSRVDYYPGFALRRQYEISKNSFFVSIFVVLVAVTLSLYPISAHADEQAAQLKGNECTETQCTTHCPTDNMSKEIRMSSNLQHNIILSSY